MNKRILSLVVAGLIFIGGQTAITHANGKEIRNNDTIFRYDDQSPSYTGWFNNDFGEWYYIKDGRFVENEWVKDKGSWYYFDEYGNMISNTVKYIDGKDYIFGSNGAMVNKKGWIKLNLGQQGMWFYGKGDGTIKDQEWVKDAGKWYYLGGNGYQDYAGELTIGPADIGNKTYIFDQNGAMVEKKGWIKLWDSWYYGNGDGTMKYNQWIKDGNKWYFATYFDGLSQGGNIVTNGVFDVNEKCYIFDQNGAMIEKKGWIKVGDEWYYGNGDGTIKTGQWIKEYGKWYYLDYVYGDEIYMYGGNMIAGTSMYIDGMYYSFDGNGVCLNR